MLGGCQLDDMKPILGDSDINIDAKSVRRKLDLSTDPGEWLYFELLQQDPQGDTETGFFFYFHYCSLTRREAACIRVSATFLVIDKIHTGSDLKQIAALLHVLRIRKHREPGQDQRQ